MAADPMIHVRQPRPVAGGFWVSSFDGSGGVDYVESHPEAGSAVWTGVPALPRWATKAYAETVDWILNARAASLDRMLDAFRHRYPGARAQDFAGQPSEWWGKQFGGIVAISFPGYFGNRADTAADRSELGLLIDDAADGTDVTGFVGAPSVRLDEITPLERLAAGPGSLG